MHVPKSLPGPLITTHSTRKEEHEQGEKHVYHPYYGKNAAQMLESFAEHVEGILVAAGEVWDTPSISENIRSFMRRRYEACITAQGSNFEQHFH